MTRDEMYDGLRGVVETSWAVREFAVSISNMVSSGTITTDEGIKRVMEYDLSPPSCPYCHNTGTNVNLRGGVECAGCGHPR